MKWLNQHQRLVVLATGFSVISGGLLLGQHYQQSAELRSPSQASVVPAVAPLVVTTVPSLSTPTPQPSRTTKPSNLPSDRPPKTAASPLLTQQQAELNRQAKAVFKTSKASVDTVVEMQVAIAEGVPALSVSTTTATVLTDKNGKILHQLPTQTSYSVQPGDRAISFGTWRLPPVVWLDAGPSGLFQLGDRIYKGQLLLVSDAGRLWAVNTVNLRQYLYSVVGSEVSPSWNMEALKAQAVAARSYALTYYFKPVSPLFHLGATEYYQVYSGIQKEAERTRQAVDATAGQYVSYQGGVVESLYAASDDIVATAFRGKGMSQLGAKGLAEQGYSYQKILKYYYSGTAVGQIKQYYE